MRTTLNLPDGLLDETVALAHGTKTEVVAEALRSYRKILLRKQLLDLRGRSDLLDETFDVESLREAEQTEVVDL
ncbi:MAG: hypothetical protein EOL87_16780 [Spartobacteria bacterium]|nr:hypothetical protein [Spartobacteria bacterium]